MYIYRRHPQHMDHYKSALISVSKALRRRDVDFVLIGSAVLPLLYNIDIDPRDLDLFIRNFSTVMDYELFEEIARENDWDIGTTTHGTVFYELVVGDHVVRVDLLENILDIYVPPQLLDNAVRLRLDGVEVPSIRLEDLLLLKARAAAKEDEEFISDVAWRISDVLSGITIDREYMKRAVRYFPEDEQESIIKRLEKNGIYLE